MKRNQTLFRIEERNEIGIVRFLDRIEMYEAEHIRVALEEWIAARAPQGLVFSFAEVPYIDSAGAGVFVGIQHHLHGQLPMRLCHLAEPVRDVLTYTNLVSLFTVDDTEEQSVAALRTQLRRGTK